MTRPRLTRSCSRRFSSVTLPAPSMTIASNRLDKIVVRTQHLRPQFLCVRVICPSRQRLPDAPIHDHLTGVVPLGFSRTGFIAGSGSSPHASACATWARPICRRLAGRVVRHVLRLERRDRYASASEPGADRRRHPAFARVRWYPPIDRVRAFISPPPSGPVVSELRFHPVQGRTAGGPKVPVQPRPRDASTG